jgi:hypothetical protein
LELICLENQDKHKFNYLREEMMDNLVRVSKADNLPFKKQTFYKWYHMKKHLDIFVKFGGTLFVDVDRLAQAIDKSRPKASQG